jgi:zinc transporter 2
VTEKTALVSAAATGSKKGYTELPSDDHDHGHGHNHGHDHGHDSAHGQNHHITDANIHAAYLHVLTDLIQSIGVAIAGLVVWIKPDLQIIDPICTFIFSILVLSYTVPLILRIGTVLMEGKPHHVRL